MSTWNAVRESEKATSIMKTFYDQIGIFEIREQFARWIEERLDNELLSTEFEEIAFLFFNDLKELIICSDLNSNQTILLYERMNNLDAKRFYEHLNKGKEMELDLIGPSKPNYIELLLQNLMTSCNEFYRIPYLRFSANLNQDLMYHEFNDPKKMLTEIFTKYMDVKTWVLEELKNWQIQQIQFASGEHHLEQIQNWYQQLYNLNSKIFKLVVEHMQSHPDETLNNLAIQIEHNQKHLLNNSLIVENQPKRVVMKKRKFKTRVRCLLGSELGSQGGVIVRCRVVSDAQIQNLCADFLPKETNELKLSSSLMKYEAKNNSYYAEFDLEILTSYRVGDEKGSKGVLTEKLAILFYIESLINNVPSYIMELSLPIVLVVHNNQELQAWATIVWDNAFLQIEPKLKTLQSVSWAKLSKALSAMFVYLNEREYTKEHEEFLYQKVFQDTTPINPEAEVHWTKFCKENLICCDFSFWEWFYYTAKLIKNCFLELWKQNFIEGYISKTNTEMKLMSCGCGPGTFLLRFSERMKGAITISYINADLEVEHVMPSDTKNFWSYNCLADHIQKIVFITKLYPLGIDKNVMPVKIVEQEKPSGYVGLVMTFQQTYTFGNWLKTRAMKMFNEKQKKVTVVDKHNLVSHSGIE